MMRVAGGRPARRVCIAIVLLLALFGVLLVLYATSPFGPGISSDSVRYISAARSLAVGEGYTLYDGTPMTLWPPLFPTILSAFEVMGIDSAVGARWLNALTFAVLILAVGVTLLRYVQNPALALLGTAALSAATPLLESMVMVWSEPLFILLAFSAAALAMRYASDPRPKYLTLMTATLALACLQRYSGLALVLALSVVVGIIPGNVATASRRLRAVAVLSLSTLPLLLWSVRNRAADGTFMGPRVSSSFSIGGNLHDTASFVSAWFIPSAVPLGLRLLILAGLATAWVVFRYRGARLRGSFAERDSVLILSWTAFVYLAFLVVSASGVRVDPLSGRLLSPALPMLASCAVIALDSLVPVIPHKLSPARSAAALLILWAMYQTAWTATRFQTWVSDGIGLTSTRVRKSPMLVWVRQHSLGQPTITNDPDAVYYATGRAIQSAPVCGQAPPESGAPDLPEPPFYTIWFNADPLRGTCPLEQLTARRKFAEIARFEDGSVYEVAGQFALSP